MIAVKNLVKRHGDNEVLKGISLENPSEEVLTLMADLAADGQTMIVVNHSMHFARSAARRVHVFADGRDVESGPPEILFENPQHETTRSFLRHTI